MSESEQRAPSQHNFRRGGSRVYYASEGGYWPARGTSKDLWAHPGGAKEPAILEAGEEEEEEEEEEVSSSGEEALEGEASPRGSFRGSLRGSPSHRSQDSGYSDSGESTNAHNDGGDPRPPPPPTTTTTTTAPSAKHVTRVYLGEDARLRDGRSQRGPPQRRDRAAGLEEPAEELEHKSVLEAAAGKPPPPPPPPPRRRWSVGAEPRRRPAGGDVDPAGLGRPRTRATAVARELRNYSLQQWLKELRVLYEAECMNTLQSKCLPGADSGRRRPQPPPTTRDAVRAIQRRAHAVSTEFARLCQRLEWLELRQVPQLAESLVSHIDNFLRDYTTQWTAAHPDLQPQSSLGRQSKVIRQICERLTEACRNDHDDPDHDTTRQVVQVVTALGHAFTKLVDLMLSREIKVVVRALEEADSKAEVRSVVSDLTALGVDGGHICRLIARFGGVRSLLGVCLEPWMRQCRVDALRALATVCCVVEGIAELDKAGGVEVVSEVLCDEDCPEEERSEAAGVLAQITSPWVENTHRLAALHAHMHAIVAALTDLAEFTRTPEIFLLASAALANLTFLDGGCVGAMRAAGTARVLLRAARDNPSLSIFTKDQIATVLANLAGSKEAAEEVVSGGGVTVLLALLNTRPAPSHRLPEVATAERVQQKSAIALSRLCRELSVARRVAEMGGAERLVRLCKDEQERNHSDAVLVACLAALRKMASSLGLEELRGMDAAELVEPRLLDSFLIYSSRQESFV